MHIGILSDTHDRLDTLKQAVAIFKKQSVAQIVHCGDWVSPFTLEYFDSICTDFRVPVYSVFGNNEGDIRRIIERNAKLQNPIHFTSKQTLTLEVEDRKIIVYHGQDKTITEAIVKSQLYDTFFTGHTHIPLNKTDGKTLILNPGSTSYTAKSQVIETASVGVYNSQFHTAQIFFL